MSAMTPIGFRFSAKSGIPEWPKLHRHYWPREFSLSIFDKQHKSCCHLCMAMEIYYLACNITAESDLKATIREMRWPANINVTGLILSWASYINNEVRFFRMNIVILYMSKFTSLLCHKWHHTRLSRFLRGEKYFIALSSVRPGI